MVSGGLVVLVVAVIALTNLCLGYAAGVYVYRRRISLATALLGPNRVDEGDVPEPPQETVEPLSVAEPIPRPRRPRPRRRPPRSSSAEPQGDVPPSPDESESAADATEPSSPPAQASETAELAKRDRPVLPPDDELKSAGRPPAEAQQAATPQTNSGQPPSERDDESPVQQASAQVGQLDHVVHVLESLLSEASDCRQELDSYANAPDENSFAALIEELDEFHTRAKADLSAALNGMEGTEFAEQSAATLASLAQALDATVESVRDLSYDKSSQQETFSKLKSANERVCTSLRDCHQQLRRSNVA